MISLRCGQREREGGGGERDRETEREKEREIFNLVYQLPFENPYLCKVSRSDKRKSET